MANSLDRGARSWPSRSTRCASAGTTSTRALSVNSASTTVNPARPARGTVTVSIIIKALNEERHIEAAVRSALAAIGALDGEVILADSGSSDRTIEIARQYPIAIVQLAHPAERRCGIGPQLGYQ